MALGFGGCFFLLFSFSWKFWLWCLWVLIYTEQSGLVSCYIMLFLMIANPWQIAFIAFNHVFVQFFTIGTKCTSTHTYTHAFLFYNVIYIFPIIKRQGMYFFCVSCFLFYAVNLCFRILQCINAFFVMIKILLHISAMCCIFIYAYF